MALYEPALTSCRTSSVCAGKVIHAMVAHLDAVTSLAVDPNGIYLMSGSKSHAHAHAHAHAHLNQTGCKDESVM